MTFVDILTSQLFVLGFIGLILFYITVESYFSYKSRKPHKDTMMAGSIPLALLGAYAFLTGLYGQLTWPLPGSYNILFYDVYTLIGLLMIGGAWAVRSKVRLQYIGVLSLLLGAMVAFYGVAGYLQKLTSEPIGLLLLYLGFGAAGVLGLPITIMLDRAQEGIKNKWIGWKVVVVFFALALLGGSLVTLYIAGSAVPAHLLSPP